MAKIALLAGDGVGPEVTAEALKVLESVGKRYGLTLEVAASPVGGAAIEACGSPCPPETLAACRAADAILFGAVGDPRYEGRDITPEQGILALRRELELFANLRPVKVFASLVNASTLKPEVVRGVDIMVVRELTGGVYFGEPRGVENTPRGKRAFNTLAYTEFEIERITRLAFETARKRDRRVTSVDKANALETFRLWRQKVTELGKEYPDVALEHMYVDNASMQLVRRPKHFDVILTGNMFGDILSDEASQIAGSIGLLPSASLGTGTALYEPIHGSAPDIAGQGIANPCAAIMSAAMMLRYSLNLPEAADAVERAVEQALEEGNRTADLAGEGPALSTAEMGDVIASRI